MTALPSAVSVDCPAKTNLTLHVGAPRAEWNGRHELDTIYCAVGVYDTVTVARKAPGTGFSLDLEGAHLGDLASSGSDMRRNHAVLALFALAEASGNEPDVALSIDKRIPVGAGLAGGSADAAATLLALNKLWNLDWLMARLQQVAATLGADMPFCLSGGYAHGTGFGERIEELPSDGDTVRDLTDRGLQDACWWAPIVRNYARRKYMRHSIGSAPEKVMTIICSRLRSHCIPVAGRPSKWRLRLVQATHSSRARDRPSSLSYRMTGHPNP